MTNWEKHAIEISNKYQNLNTESFRCERDKMFLALRTIVEKYTELKNPSLFQAIDWLTQEATVCKYCKDNICELRTIDRECFGTEDLMECCGMLTQQEVESEESPCKTCKNCDITICGIGQSSICNECERNDLAKMEHKATGDYYEAESEEPNPCDKCAGMDWGDCAICEFRDNLRKKDESNHIGEVNEMVTPQQSNERLIPCKHSATINGWQEPLPNGTYKDINIVALRCENDMCGCYGGFCEPNCEKYEMPKGTYNFGNIEQLGIEVV